MALGNADGVGDGRGGRAAAPEVAKFDVAARAWALAGCSGDGDNRKMWGEVGADGSLPTPFEQRN